MSGRSKAAKRRRYLRWCRYVNRINAVAGCRIDADGDRWPAHAATWGVARAASSQYRNGTRLPYGWQPRQPRAGSRGG